MKFPFMIIFFVSYALLVSSCSHSYSDVKSITVIVDPNKKENKYQVISIIAEDSIQAFMVKLNNRKTELVKFFPRYSIQINYVNRTEKYLGNANHIKDASGHTYKLLVKEWEIFNY